MFDDLKKMKVNKPENGRRQKSIEEDYREIEVVVSDDYDDDDDNDDGNV